MNAHFNFAQLKSRSLAALAAAVAVALTACGGQPDSAISESPRMGTFGVETQHVSASVHPGDDFFTYVNEGWLDSVEMPPGFSRFGSFTELALEAEENVDAIIQEARDDRHAAGTPQQQIGDLFDAYMNTEQLEALGLSPIAETLDTLLGLDSHEEVARWMAKPGTNAIVGAFITQDQGDPTRYLTYTGQGGLGLPNKEYYEREDAPFPEHRDAYQAYIQATFERAGVDRAAERAADVMALETRLAAVHWTRVQQRDREANYNLMTRAELDEFAPGFPWQTFFSVRGLGDIDELVVSANTAVQASAELFAETPVDTWSSYHAFHWINNHAPLLSSEHADAHVDFFSRR